MLNKTLLIVSDKFHNFATRKDVITKSELYNLLQAENVVFPKKDPIYLIPGQGFSENDVKNILNLALSAKNASYFDFSMWQSLPKRASSQLTHKYKKENILISEPERVSCDEFSMNVLIDESCEMMRDHQTGLHVQGIILLEASRQGYLAIIEKFFSSAAMDKKYFIFNSMNVNYNRFAFPLPATLKVIIREKDLSNSKKQQATMDMEIIQCGNCSASFSLDMTIMANKRIAIMETKLASQSLDDHINHLIAKEYTMEMSHA
jgi:hypothetical protein